jgi:hypothetical protein
MQLKFNNSTQELVDLYVFNTWSAPWKKNTRQKAGVMLPIAFALFAFAFLINGTSMPLGIVLLVCAGLWLIFYNKIYTKRLASFAKGYYNHEVNERFWTESTYDFNDAHIRVINEYVDAKIQWKAIINVIEQDDVYWLFETLSAAHIIPKRILGEQEAAFKSLLASKLLDK